ncbi:LysR family transcriptional regulator [Candidatus Symbiopectobacterium sp. 'North America']|uniref:LysR family transcriptional regulator n=1 Tax=Candidatus Symbiopectobacterium sp. 'North America' TaxID=2794574 RepID=UPI0018CB2BD1|nr:LysR family transcriptional regulator [Candidatus Symbiopectobacterium sp. 'North America']MBG6244559.1 LysR family transcriptional regulator [Candidatus Symbiopectobacterium sp. 'North America']
MLNIKNIIHFQIFSKVGSFTKTAIMLNISQSNLTHSITRLEQEINIKLINRTTRTFSLTEFGAVFAQRCERIVDEFDQLMALVDAHQGKGTLDHAFIGVIPPVGRMDFFKNFLALNQTAKNINYSFVDGSSHALIEKVKNTTLLAAFGTPSQEELDDGLLEHQLVLEDQIVAVLPSQHALALKSEIGLSDLAHENVILPQKDTGAYSIISTAFSLAGIKPRQYKECSQIDIVMDMVENNAGIALFSSSIVDLYKGEHVVTIPLKQKINKSINQ